MSGFVGALATAIAGALAGALRIRWLYRQIYFLISWEGFVWGWGCIGQAGDTALTLAVCLERWPCAELLLSRGGAAVLQARDMLGWTPLHQALACLPKAADPEAAAAWVKTASAADEQLRAAAQTDVDAAALAAAAGCALEHFLQRRC